MRLRRPQHGAYLVDAPFLYAVIVLIEQMSGAGPLGLFGFEPHPYWIPILTLAAAQGTVAGLFAVLMGVSIQVLGLTLAQDLSTAVGTLVTSPASTLYFLAGAFVIGEIHDVHAGKFQKIHRQLSDESSKAAQLQYERDVLMTANARLRQRIEEEPQQLAELIGSTTKIQRSRSDEIYGVLLEVVRSHCGATKASILERSENGAWSLRATMGWTDEERDERLAALRSSPIIEAATKDVRGVQAFEMGVALRALDPFYAVPLSRADGSIRAVVSLDEMPAQQVSPGVAAVFFGIAEWADASLALGAMESDVRGRSRRLVNVATLDALSERLRLEYHRIERYGARVSIACIHVPQWHHQSSAANEELDRVVFAHLFDVLGSETLYKFGAPGCYVAIHMGEMAPGEALPASDVQDAWLLACANTRPPLAMHWVPVDVKVPDPHTLMTHIASYFQEHAGRGGTAVLDAIRSQSGNVFDLDTLLRRAPLEAALATETGDPCQAVLVCADAADRPFEPEALRAAAQILRPTDGVFLVSERVLVLLLPSSEPVDAEVATTRLLDALRTQEAQAGHGSRSLEVEMVCIQRLAEHPFAIFGVGEEGA